MRHSLVLNDADERAANDRSGCAVKSTESAMETESFSKSHKPTAP